MSNIDLLFSKLKGGGGSGNFGHAGRKGKKGGSAKGITTISGKNYMVGTWGEDTGHEGMSDQEKSEFDGYVKSTMAKLFRGGGQGTPLHPAQLERWVGMKGGTFEINAVKVNKKIVLKTKPETYINVLNGKQQLEIHKAVRWAAAGNPLSAGIPVMKGSPKIVNREMFNF